VIGASLYIITHSAKNRVRVRLRRLREPRYLIGAIVGAAYLYFSVFARFQRGQRITAARRRSRSAPPVEFATLAAVGPALGGLVLMLLTTASWAFPFESGLLDFSESEVQFLFPAPVSRRALLGHRLMRSQLGLLFGALVAGLFAPSVSSVSRLRLGVAMWMVLCVGKVYFTGVSLARARLASRDTHVRRVAWLPLLALGAALLVVGQALYAALIVRPLAGPGDLLTRLADVSASGLSRVVMWPFIAVVRPVFADWPGPFLTSLVGAAVVLAVCVAWVMKSDEAFYAATEQVTRPRDKQPGQARARYRARAAGWTLAPAGRPELAFAWKAAMQTFRLVDVRVLVRITSMLFALTIVAVSVGSRSGLTGAFAAFALVGSAFGLILAPQAIRMDLRQDLQHLELIKMWPLRSADVVRGEMLWPGVLITALAWTMITMATFLSGALFDGTTVLLRASIGAAAFVLAPGLAFAQLAIHNGVALLFPAWVSLGSQRARGLDAMGQRILMLGGTWIVLAVMALPGAVAGGIVWFALRLVVGSVALVPAAAVCTAVLLTEVFVMTEMLGPAYERLDILAVERPE
jgi:hypothetical protein